MAEHLYQRAPRPRLTIVGTLIGILSLAAVLTASGASVIFAQSSTATLSGTIIDQASAVVSGAAVTVVNDATRATRQATTNDDGLFVVPLLPPGRYTVSAKRDGFTPVELKNVVLEVGDQLALRLQMKVGSVGESVTIVDGVSIIRDEAGVGTVVNRQFVGNLPLNGRSFQSLIALSPGVVLTKATGNEAGQFSVNGQRANSNYFTVDGVSANIGVGLNFLPGQLSGGTVPGLSATGGTNNLVSIDALQEFKIQTSTYAPEFGRTPGAQVSIVTRSGGNEYRGALFEYFRNDALDANDWFANSRGQQRPALRQNIFGGVLGGPVSLPKKVFGPLGYEGRDRTFFFVSYEGQRLRLPQFQITDVPSLTARQTAIEGIKPYLNAFPLPTGPVKASGYAEFASSFSNPSSLDATSFRLDHTVNNRLTLFGRYNYSPSETVLRGNGNSLNTKNTVPIRTQTLTLGSTQTITPRMSNDLRVNYSHNRGGNRYELDGFGGAVRPDDSVLFPASTSSQDAQLFFQLGGGTGSSFQLGTSINNVQRQFNLVDNLSAVLGSHQLKFGVDYRRLSPLIATRKYFQQALFANLANALLGRPSSVTLQASNVHLTVLLTNFSGYAQDTWRISSRLTLTFGLRYEVNPTPSTANGNDPFAVTGIDNPASLALAPAGTPLYDTTYNNFAPRVGAAYQLSQRPGRETVLRGGFGVFYDLGNGQAIQAFTQYPYVVSRSLPAGTTFPLTPAIAAPPAIDQNTRPISQFFASDPQLKLPYTYQWNFAVEQSLGRNQTVSASYVAAVGRRLLRSENIRNPNPTFGTVMLVRNTATSDYHALQLQYQRRLARGLQALASYTWSHSLDIASNDSSFNTPAGRLDPRLDRGPSDFDVRHAFTTAVTYDFPKLNAGAIGNAILNHWSADAIVSARSATPVNVTVTRDIGFGSYQFRPDLIQGVPLYLDDPAAGGGRRFNPAAFSAPKEARQGTLGRNVLRGFPVSQLDFAVRRQFSLAENLKLQFKAELFNAFNHPNFADPIGVFGSVSAAGTFTPVSIFGFSQSMLGRSLGTGGSNGGLNPLYQIGGPRSVQLSMRLQF